MNDDILNDVLKAMGGRNPAAQDIPETRFTIPNVIEVPQTKSSRHVNDKGVPMAGMLYVGPIEDTHHGTYVESLDFLLVDSLVFSLPSLKSTGRMEEVGGRRMRGYSLGANGVYVRDIQQPDTCRSTNGAAPFEQYIGTEVVDPRTGKTHVIGTDEQGRWITQTVSILGTELPDICRRCPLSQWINNQKPPCESSRRYVVCILPDKTFPEPMLATIRGENSGIDNALRGAAANSTAAAIDGRALMGIRQPFAPTSDRRQIVVPKDRTTGRERFIVAGCQNTSMEGASYPFDPDKHDYAVLSVPTYRYAPEGRPEEVGEFTKVYRVRMRVTRNAYTMNGRPMPTFVPDIQVTDVLVTEREYTAYLDIVHQYYSHNMTAILARLSDVVSQKTNERLQLLSGSSAAQLPANTTSADENGIVF